MYRTIKIGKALLDLDFIVDEEQWGKAFNPINKEHITEEIVNGYITQIIIYH